MKKSNIITKGAVKKTTKKTAKQTSKAKQATKTNKAKQTSTKTNKAKQATKQGKARKARSSGFSAVDGNKDVVAVRSAKCWAARGYDIQREAGKTIKAGTLIECKYGLHVVEQDIDGATASNVIKQFKKNANATLAETTTLAGHKVEAGQKLEIMLKVGNDDYGKGKEFVHGCMTYLIARFKKGGKWVMFNGEVLRWHDVKTTLVKLA